jgi:hypothetical protein
MAEGSSRELDHVRRALAAWAEADQARALHPVDRDVIRATEAARCLVLELFASADPRDLWSACARLGGLMADAGGSPSLAAGAIDSAARALAEAGLEHDPARIAPARASLLEGYVASVREAERNAGLASWEYPACAVPLGDGSVAVACGYPTDDGEVLAAWAARVAGRLVKDGVRKVVLAGSPDATAELESAVTLVGIEVSRRARAPSAARAPQSSGWLARLWRKKTS